LQKEGVIMEGKKKKKEGGIPRGDGGGAGAAGRRGHVSEIFHCRCTLIKMITKKRILLTHKKFSLSAPPFPFLIVFFTS
jgi:hypothetical protein